MTSFYPLEFGQHHHLGNCITTWPLLVGRCPRGVWCGKAHGGPGACLSTVSRCWQSLSTEAIYLEGQHSKTHHSWTLECLGNGMPWITIDHGSTMPNLKMGPPRNLGPWRIPTLNRNGVWWNGPKLSDLASIGFLDTRSWGKGKVKV